jgi:hypothetical protein
MGTAPNELVLIGIVLLGLGGLIFAVQESRKYEYKAETKDWKGIMAIWERLYYCEHDSRIFDPLTGESADLDHLHELLYRILEL